jgi:exosortase A
MVEEETQYSSLESRPAAHARFPLRAARERLAPLALVCAAVVALYWPAASALSSLWIDDARGTYLHGFLIAAVALWLLAARWRELLMLPVRPDAGALPLLVLLQIAWLVALRGGVQVAYEALLPVLLWCAILAVLGRPIARCCAFPLAFLYFAIPFWDVAINGLVFLTAHISADLARLAGVAAQVDGNLVHVPAGTFEVADGCSGLGYLIVGLATGALYGELHGQPVSRRAMLLAMAGALSIAANWIRVAIIVVIGQVTSLRASLVRPGEYHYLFGWAVLGVILIAYVILTDRWLEPSSPRAAGEPKANPALAGREERGSAVAVAACALLLLALGPALTVYDGRLAPAPVSAEPLRPGQGGWQGPMAAAGAWRPRFPGADSRASAQYRDGGATVAVYIAGYASQRHGKKFIGYDTSALAKGDQVLAVQPIRAAGISILERVLSDDRGARLLLWQWYQVDGRAFASGSRAQLWYGVEAVAAIPRSRTVVLRSPCRTSCAETRARLQQFVRDNPWLRFN